MGANPRARSTDRFAFASPLGVVLLPSYSVDLLLPMLRTRLSLLALLCLTFTLLLGCDSGGRPTYPVSGKVTWKGQPVPKGLIYFDPDVHQANDGPQGFALIVNGQYDTRSDGRNVIEGPHIVRVEGYDGQEGSELPLGRLIFSEYAFNHELPAKQSTLDIDVPENYQKSAPAFIVP